MLQVKYLQICQGAEDYYLAVGTWNFNQGVLHSITLIEQMSGCLRPEDDTLCMVRE